MLHRRSARLLVAAASVATLACSNSVPSPLQTQSQSLAGDQSLRVHLPEAPRSLDPALAQDEREAAVLAETSEPLLRPAAGMLDVQPAAAESYSTSDDGVTWTFRIRSGARWSDGQPVRAQDFVYAWKRLIDPRTAAPHANWFASVVKGGEEAAALDVHDPARIDAAIAALGLSAPDEQTFQVVEPRPALQLRWVATLPEGGPERPDLVDHPGSVTSGPFRVTDAARDHTTLAPNPNYWAGRTTLSKLELEYGGDSAGAVAAYRSSSLDVVAQLAGQLDTATAREAVRRPELTVFWLDFNVERPPFTDPRVRQAFAEAVDRQALAAAAFAGMAVPATTLVPDGMRGYHPEYGHAQETNLAAARTLLQQAAPPRDQLGALPLIVRDRPFDRAVAAGVADQLQRNLGVTVSVQPLAVADYTKRLRAGDFALAGPTGWSADYPDQQDFYDVLESTSGDNGSRYRSARYDSLVRAADVETSVDRRDQLYAQAAQLLDADAPVLFLVQRQRWALVRPYVKGAPALPVDAWPGATYASALWIAAH